MLWLLPLLKDLLGRFAVDLACFMLQPPSIAGPDALHVYEATFSRCLSHYQDVKAWQPCEKVAKPAIPFDLIALYCMQRGGAPPGAGTTTGQGR
jgi:hypothetical protein